MPAASTGLSRAVSSSRRALIHADRRGWTSTSTQAIRISTGTMSLNALAGSDSNAAAPATDPAPAAAPSRSSRPRCPSSSRRYPNPLLTLPGTSPTLLETLATTGGKPKASRVGKVISDPDPTTALMAPAPQPAARIASASPGPKSGEPAGARGPPRGAAFDEQRDAEALGQIPLGEHVKNGARGEHGALAQQHRVRE